MALTEKRDMLGDMMTVKKWLERSQQKMFPAATGLGIGDGIGSGQLVFSY